MKTQCLDLAIACITYFYFHINNITIDSDFKYPYRIWFIGVIISLGAAYIVSISHVPYVIFSISPRNTKLG